MAWSVVKSGYDMHPAIGDHWDRWLRSADDLYMRFTPVLSGSSPLEHQKSASVGFLTNSAALAGYLPVIENDASGTRLDHWGVENNRADFCFYAEECTYFFKFRRAGRASSIAYLRRQMEHALDRLSISSRNSGRYAAGCVSVTARDTDCIKVCEKFATSDYADFAYRIGPATAPAFVFFRLKE